MQFELTSFVLNRGGSIKAQFKVFDACGDQREYVRVELRPGALEDFGLLYEEGGSLDKIVDGLKEIVGWRYELREVLPAWNEVDDSLPMVPAPGIIQYQENVYTWFDENLQVRGATGTLDQARYDRAEYMEKHGNV